MTDKPKRKRSERAKPLWRLRWLTLVYFLLLAPYLFDFRFFLSILVVLAIILSVLLIGSYTMILLRRLKQNFLTALAVAVIGGASTTFAALMFIVPAWGGLILWLIALSPYASFAPINIWGVIIAIIVPSVICLAFTLELHMQITEFMNPLPNNTFETEKQKDVAMENTESDIPLELLAEVESVRQKMK